MNKNFFIEITMKTVGGPECIAKFFIGTDEHVANEIYLQLNGSRDVNEKNILNFCFVESRQGIPLNLKMLSCTLDQLGENCKLITKELFRINNLGLP